ncbi:MAG: cache domain-containing protein, partial [Clostridia bacterium]|nr:cache domain-containing protein [Clostridia bacterium]
MLRRALKQTRHRRVQLQMVVLLLLFTLLTTQLTGWVIYELLSDQVIRDTWQQQEALLRSACASVNREIEQVKSFSWQLSNDNGVEKYLRLKEQTPKDILAKRDIIEELQQMKAYSNTIADIGIYAEGLDIIVTGESSYQAADFYSRITEITQQQMEEERAVPGTVALGRFVGRGTLHRILTEEPVLTFISSLPLNALSGKSYAFFHLNADKLYACLPESEAGTLLLTDREGNPVMPADSGNYSGISRQYMLDRQNRIKADGAEYGVLGAETAADGLYCTAVIPYSALLEPQVRLRNIVMWVMGSCMAVGLVAAVLASKRLYAPLERLIGNVRQLCNSLPEENRGSEYKLLDDAIHLITTENHELTLSNREVNRLLKNRLLNDWMEGRLKGRAEETLGKAGVELPYSRVQIAVAETAPRDLERLEARTGGNTADRVEDLAVPENAGPLKVWCAQRTDGMILILFNLEEPAGPD